MKGVKSVMLPDTMHIIIIYITLCFSGNHYQIVTWGDLLESGSQTLSSASVQMRKLKSKMVMLLPQPI